jgi:hypothetical protein
MFFRHYPILSHFKSTEKPMRYAEKPIYRKIIVPWYDSEAACMVILVLMIPVLIFGGIGHGITRRVPEYHDLFWIPSILILLSLLVIILTLSRLIRRWIDRKSR